MKQARLAILLVLVDYALQHVSETSLTQYKIIVAPNKIRCSELDKTLLLEVFIRFTVVHVAFIIFKFLHRLLLENLLLAFPF